MPNDIKNPEFKKLLEEVKPDIERLVHNADKPHIVISGFIFSPTLGLIRFGNNGNKGGAFIKLHLVLSTLATEMETMNPYPQMSFADIGGESVGGVRERSEVIADELAQLIMITGLETNQEKIISLAHRYIIARRA